MDDGEQVFPGPFARARLRGGGCIFFVRWRRFWPGEPKPLWGVNYDDDAINWLRAPQLLAAGPSVIHNREPVPVFVYSLLPWVKTNNRVLSRCS